MFKFFRQSENGELKRISGQFDIADPSAVEKLRLEVQNDFGPVDILVNNAAVLPMGSFMSGSFEQRKRIVDVNINAVMLVMKLIAKNVKKCIEPDPSFLDDSCVFGIHDASS